MYELVSKTTVTRVTVSTSAAQIVPPENVLRRVTLLPPASPQMFWMIDADGDAIADCRAYQWAPMGTYPVPPFLLQPGQFVSAIADTAGQAPVAVICEYLKGPVSG